MLNNSASCPSQQMHLNVLCPMVTTEGILLQTTSCGNKILLTQHGWQDQDRRELWVVSLGFFFHFLIHSIEARVDTNTICNWLHQCWRPSLIFKQQIDKELSLCLKLWLKWRKVFQKISGYFLSKVSSLCQDLIFSLRSAMKFEYPLYAA